MRPAELTPRQQERRDRLAAERLLATSCDASADRMRKLEQANGTLHRRLSDWRTEAERLSVELDTLRQAQDAAARATARERAEQGMEETSLWAALQTVRDGFAMFNKDRRLVIANAAFVAVFDGLEVVRPGVSVSELFHILLDEGIIDPGELGRDWPGHMVARWDADPIPSGKLRLWNGQIVKLMETRLPNGGVVLRGINLTETLRLQSAIEALPDGFVIYDAEDRLVTANESYRDFYAASREAIVPGAPFVDILRYGLERGQYKAALGQEAEWLEQRIEQHQAVDGIPREQELGDGRWLRILEVPTPDGGRAGFRFDITRMKQQEMELRRMHMAARAAERAKSAFLANMGHEIRTPMNGLVGTADLLLDTVLNPSQTELVRTLRQSAVALLTFMDDVLDFSRAEADRIELSTAPFSPRAVLEETVASFAAQAHLKGLRLTTQIAADVAPAYTGDARRIRQILANLVGNALKFTDSGTVAVGAAAEHNASGPAFVLFSVADTGCGVPPDRAAHIFDGFVQGDDGTTRPHDGSGLGLAICRKLATQMGGRIDYMPRPGGGSVFRCRLPLTGATLDADQAVPPDSAKCPSDRVLRIIAAEDKATNRMVLDKLLEPLGVDLHMVSNGRDCVAAVSDDPPDLVLMDISMPDMDGCDATRHIRRWEDRTGRPPLPIIAMTAHVLPDEVAKFLDAGMDRVITKPLKRDALMAEVEAVRAARAAMGAGQDDTEATGSAPSGAEA